MSLESNLQSKIRNYLESKGCYVLVTTVGPGIPTGCSDIIFMLEGFWGAIEVKDSPKAKYQPLQKETLEKFNSWSWGRRVDPTNWDEVKGELERML
jgi:Holliday junction resolvase